MRAGYSLYKNQGIHTIVSIFTVEKGTIKVLLIKRTNEPFKGMWGLVGGALYNNETLDECVKREIFEKTGLTDVKVYQSSIFDRIDRSPSMRMIAISYVGIVDSSHCLSLSVYSFIHANQSSYSSITFCNRCSSCEIEIRAFCSCLQWTSSC